MASTFSDLKIELMATGEQSGTWGTTTNTNLGTAIEQAITGSGDVSFSSADVTLTLTDTNASQTARNLRLNLTGTSGGARNLIVPAIEKQYIINNGLADAVTVKNSTGTGVAVPAGKTMVVFNNATNVVDVTTYASSLTLGAALPIASGGTNATATPTAGAVTYGTGTAYAFNTAGTSGQALLSGGSGAPTFGTLGVAAGGTGQTSLTLNNVILGNGTSGVQFVAPGSSGNVLTSNGTTWASTALPAGGLTYVYKTSNYTTQDKEGVLADTSGGSFTVTLPATPAVGAQVVVADAGAFWGTNNLTVGRNGSTIGGLAQDLVCDITGASVQLVYDGTTWEVYAQIGGNGGTAVTLDGVQTLTNKTIAFSSNTLTDVASTNTSQTLTNKTIAFGSNTLSNVLSDNTVQTVTGTKTFAGTTSTLAAVLTNAAEVATISATAATGTINYDVTTQSVLYYTSNASANWTVNFRASSGTSLNTAMATGQSVTVAFLVTQGATAYYNSAVQVDGSSVTPKWQGGTAPTAGNASGVDSYVYTIVKTGSATFTVFASQTQFK